LSFVESISLATRMALTVSPRALKVQTNGSQRTTLHIADCSDRVNVVRELERE
jgi:hypothetical protein